MDASYIDPRDGDLVVVRAASATDGQLSVGPKRYAVIEWGFFQLVATRMGSLSKDEAVLAARHCAAERGRDAWDSTGQQMTRLPRLPLIYRGVANTYAVSVDVTDYTKGQPTVWKSMSHLSEAEALDVIGANGVSLAMAKALLGMAPMPLACS